jgi:hypothetical protein
MEAERIYEDEEFTLLELLDRILDKGVVIQGDLILSVADVDLVYLGLRVLLTSADRMEELGIPDFGFAHTDPS